MKIKKIWKCVLNIISIIGSIIIAFLVGIGINKRKEIKQKNWKPIKDRPNYIELYENGKWKEIKLPKNKDGKQIKNDEIKTINISKEGNINVKIKKGTTDRRNIPSLDDDTFTWMDL